MSGDATVLAAAARALNRRHGDLLAGECSFRETTAQLAAVEALDAARDRLRGGGRPVAPQLALDVRTR